MSNVANDLIGKGWAHHQSGNLDAAADCYRRAIQHDVNNFDSWHLLGLSLIQKGIPAEAAKSLARAVELNSSNIDARLHLGTALAQNAEPGKALVQFEAAQQLNPRSPVAYLNKGLALAALSRFEEAKASFTRLLSLEPNNPVALLNLGRIESELGNSTESIEIFRQLELAYPREKSIFLMHAIALHKSKDHESALSKIDSCLRLDPSFDDAINSKGLILRAMGRLDEALACFKSANALSPHNPSHLGQLGALENELGDFKTAEIHLRRACEISPNSPNLLINLGLSLAKQGFNLEAVEQYKKALAINPRDFDGLNNLGASLLKLDAFDDAMKALSAALEINSKSTAAIYNLAKCLNKSHRHLEAIKLCLRAIETDPAAVEPYIEIAAGYAAVGQDSKACKYLKLGLQNAGNNSILLNNLGIIESDIGSPRDALAYLSMSEAADPNYPEPKFNKSLIQIKLQEFSVGWKNFEFRWLTQKFDSDRIQFSCPQWTGETCKNLIIWREQGIGDQLLFCTLLVIIKQFVPNIAVIIDPRLISVMSANHPSIQFVGNRADLSNSYFDFHIPMGSLPALFCKSLDAITNKPFAALSPPANKVAEVTKLLPSPTKARIGIAWRSSNNPGAQAKSLNLEVLSKAIDLDKFELVNLQYGDVISEINRAQDSNPNFQLRSFPTLDLYKDVDALAALIEKCDLVLTSSNVTAHLSGIMGKPTIVLTPFAKGKHWYWWHTNNHQSLWYPTVHVLSQGADLNWEIPVLQAKKLLPQLLKY